MRILVLLFLSACGDKENTGSTGGGDGTDCSGMAVPSVEAQVTNEQGTRLEEATVSWTSADDGGDCTYNEESLAWICGYDVTGEITLHAEAPGHEPGERTVIVNLDDEGCHPETVQASVMLSFGPCDDSVVPAVTLYITNQDGELVEGVIADYQPVEDTSPEPVPCEDLGDGHFSCGPEVSGELEVQARALDHVSFFEIIDVQHDGCHPITEHRDVVLQAFESR